MHEHSNPTNFTYYFERDLNAVSKKIGGEASFNIFIFVQLRGMKALSKSLLFMFVFWFSVSYLKSDQFMAGTSGICRKYMVTHFTLADISFGIVKKLMVIPLKIYNVLRDFVCQPIKLQISLS